MADRRGNQQTLRSLRTLGSFSGRRAIDMQVLTDLKRDLPFQMLRQARKTRPQFDGGAFFFCCLKQDVQDFQDEQDERGLGAAQQL